MQDFASSPLRAHTQGALFAKHGTQPCTLHPENEMRIDTSKLERHLARARVALKKAEREAENARNSIAYFETNIAHARSMEIGHTQPHLEARARTSETVVATGCGYDRNGRTAKTG